MGLTVMVTGGSGLVGSYVLRQLAENGDTAINLDMREPGPEATWWLKPVADQVRSVSGGVDSWSDLAAAIMTHKPDAIIHIAAVVNQPLLNKRPALAKDINFGGTFNVLEAARLLAIKWVVYFSSIAVLPGIQYEPVDVNHPVFLGTEGPGGGFYAAAKAASEAFCWAYHQAFGVDFIVLRPSAVHGFGTRYPIYVKPMVENSVRGLPTRFERGREFPRDYTHAADVAQAAVRAAHVPPDKIKDRVFFAATGLPLVTAGGESHPDRPLLERQRLLADQSKRPGSRRPGAGDTRSLDHMGDTLEIARKFNCPVVCGGEVRHHLVHHGGVDRENVRAVCWGLQVVEAGIRVRSVTSMHWSFIEYPEMWRSS